MPSKMLFNFQGIPNFLLIFLFFFFSLSKVGLLECGCLNGQHWRGELGKYPYPLHPALILLTLILFTKIYSLSIVLILSSFLLIAFFSWLFSSFSVRVRKLITLGSPHNPPPAESAMAKIDQTRGLLRYITENFPGKCRDIRPWL